MNNSSSTPKIALKLYTVNILAIYLTQNLKVLYDVNIGKQG